MYSPRLLLYPAVIQDSLSDYQTLRQALIDLKLIHAAKNENDEYLLADECLNLLTFLGCAPSIHLSPQDGETFCYVKFNTITEYADCLGYVDSFKPNCSSCKIKLTQWRDEINWQQGLSILTCPACGHKKTLQDIRWRKEAAYARCGFYIANIHPHEALPADKLLDTLQKISGFKWAYAYANNQETL